MKEWSVIKGNERINLRTIEIPENKDRKDKQWAHEGTYVQGLLQDDPSGLGLNLKVLQIVGVDGRRETVHYRTVVIRIFIGCRDTQDVRTDTRVLLHVLHVFLKDTDRGTDIIIDVIHS